eukprot:UC4_evm4s102
MATIKKRRPPPPLPPELHANKKPEAEDSLTTDFLNLFCISSSRVTFCGVKLGCGEFGIVEKGILDGSVDIAIKSLKSKSSSTGQEEMTKEAVMMGKVDHPNIVKFYGVNLKHNKISRLLLEFLPGGSLPDFLLRWGSSISTECLLRYCEQISAALVYTSDLHIIHRDIAARNCLVSSKSLVKLADFGLARFVEKNYEIKGGKMPVKWMAPESINFKQQNLKSDVWMFGVFCWETMSYGIKPFHGFNNAEVVLKIEAGNRLSPPTGCPVVMYHIMLDCWIYTADDRPDFFELYSRIRAICSSSDPYLFREKDEISRIRKGLRSSLQPIARVDDSENTMGNLRIGCHALIRRSDGRIHPVTLDKFNLNLKIVTVAWYEDNQQRGKDIDVSEIEELNTILSKKIVYFKTMRSHDISMTPTKSCDGNATPEESVGFTEKVTIKNDAKDKLRVSEEHKAKVVHKGDSEINIVKSEVRVKNNQNRALYSPGKELNQLEKIKHSAIKNNGNRRAKNKMKNNLERSQLKLKAEAMKREIAAEERRREHSMRKKELLLTHDDNLPNNCINITKSNIIISQDHINKLRRAMQRLAKNVSDLTVTKLRSGEDMYLPIVSQIGLAFQNLMYFLKEATDKISEKQMKNEIASLILIPRPAIEEFLKYTSDAMMFSTTPELHEISKKNMLTAAFNLLCSSRQVIDALLCL